MQDFVAYLSLALIVLILGMFLRNILARTWDLFSWRNLLLLGFVHFYCLGAYYTARGETLPEYIGQITGGWADLATMMVLFLVIFLLCARFALHRPMLTRLVPKIELPVTAPAVVTSSLVLSFLGLLFSIPFFNYFGVIAAQVRGQLGACAVGLATYYLVSRRFNPAAWAFFIATLGMGAVSSTVGLPGRRLFVGVMLAVPWMWYFSVWRYRSPVSNIIRVTAFFVAGVLGVIMYSPIRAGQEQKTEVEATISKRSEQFFELVTNPKIDTNVIKYLLYTDTVPNTLYILQNYPENHKFMPFHGLLWFLANPIPRQLWPSKPEALGGILRDQMHVVPNLGPGIIGHGWSEAWIPGVIYYAVFFGFLIGIVDRACAERCWNPFFLAVFGGNLGNVLALTRGDTPLFMIQIVGGLVSSALVLYLLKSVSPVWASFPLLLPPGATVESPQDAAPPDGQNESVTEQTLQEA